MNNPVEDRRTGAINLSLSNQVYQIQQLERVAKDKFWRAEIQAQKLGQLLDARWDALNRSEQRLKDAGDHDWGRIEIGEWAFTESRQHGVERWEPNGERTLATSDAWDAWLSGWRAEGWQIEFLEFRHQAFDEIDPGKRFRSRVHFVVAVEKRMPAARCLVRGQLIIEWSLGEPVVIHSVDARALKMIRRSGEPPFKLIFEEAIEPPRNAHSIDPLMVHDLDGDGFAEIILAGRNLIFRRGNEGDYRAEPWCSFPPGLISTAVLADTTNDGMADFLCMTRQGLLCLEGSSHGIYDQPGKQVWVPPEPLAYPMVLSAGDYDVDGDLDLFLGQYRIPYEGGSLPTPFFDANDGEPFYLLRNEGDGRFVDVTDQSGLTERRHRRVYSASFAELNGRGGPDLMVVSDFAGIDLYFGGDGKTFRKAGSELLGDTLGFGMAHTFGDFDANGQLDLLMIGMTSATVDRLTHRSLWRPGLASDPSFRSRLAYGNRLLLSMGDAGFVQNKLGASIARGGWAWGCASADFDNDGYPDVFLANGLESRESVRDYESHYWLHDAFVATSEPDSAAYLYFEEKFAATRGQGHSYGGYEYDRLYLNQGGETFAECGFLLGVSRQRDSRNVVAEDLDQDGRVDLIVTSFELWPEPKQTLRIYHNQLASVGNWVSFDFDRRESSVSPMGAQITVDLGERKYIDEIVSGDSYRSQHAYRLHFGVGNEKEIPAIRVRWSDGYELKAKALPSNQPYRVFRDRVERLSGKE